MVFRFRGSEKHVIFASMSLKLMEFLVYLCSGMICLVLGMVLIGVRTRENNGSNNFRFVLRSIAFAAFLDVLFDVVVIYLQWLKVDYVVTNHFFAPLIMYSQIFLGVGAMLKLFRSEDLRRSISAICCCLFLRCLFCLYIVAFIRETDSITLASYVEFIKLGSANFLSGTLLVCLLIELMVVGFWLYREMSRYNRLLGDYYTDNHIEDGHKVYSIMLAFTIYIVTTFFFFFSENAVHRLVTMSLNTCLFVLFTVVLINLQHIFNLVSPAFTYNESPHKNKDTFTVAGDVNDNEDFMDSDMIPEPSPIEETASDVQEPAETASDNETPDRRRIDEIVKQWSESPDKLYLTEGITLSSAADSMGVRPRLLSDFLNNIYEMNFNTWIKSLRVEEVKRLLRQTEPKMTLLDIAALTGFPDASSMSKAFKLFTGMTPSAYRTSNGGGTSNRS